MPTEKWPLLHDGGMSHKTTPTESKYRLAPDRAAIVRTAPPVVMTILEAAAYLAVSPRTIRLLIDSRKLKSARIGSKVILRREWLDAVLGD